jgi:hypothetical protein
MASDSQFHCNSIFHRSKKEGNKDTLFSGWYKIFKHVLSIVDRAVPDIYEEDTNKKKAESR